MATAFFRTLILYITLIIGLRLTGKRQISELEPIELVLTMLLSDLAAVPMQDFGIPLVQGLIPIVTLLSLSMLLSSWSLTNLRFRRLICGQPTVIIRDGVIVQDAMHRTRLTLDELMEELRLQGITDLTTVKYALLETGGQLSVLLYPQYQPLTPQTAGHTVADDLLLPTVIINDGRLLQDRLRQSGRDEKWLRAQLRQARATEPTEIFLLTVDAHGKTLCIRKEDRP